MAGNDHTLTEAHVEQFWAAMDLWQERLGLLDWRIVKSSVRAKNAMAEMRSFSWPQRQVTCRVGLNWKSCAPTPVAIEQTAVHELLHVLLKPLVEVARNDGCEEDIMNAEHAVINVLERLLVPDRGAQ